MKRIILLISSIITFSVLTIAQPKLEIVNGDTYDWGNVKMGQSPLVAKIQLKNVGNEELHIQNVKPTCGCTTAPLDKDKLKPGETATLDVSLKVSGGGKISKSITITSNDPNNKIKRLDLVANVQEMLVVEPSKVFRFKDLEVGKESTSRVSVVNKDQKPIKISGLTVEEPSGLMVSFIDKNGKSSKADVVLQPGDKIDLVANVNPQKDGYFRAKVNFVTDHPDFKKIEITGYGNVKPSPIFNSKKDGAK